MIVVDASALIETLLVTKTGSAVERRLLSPEESLHAPHLIDVEVTQVLRRYSALGNLSHERALQALDDLASFPIHRYPHDVFLPRIWELRHNVTAYDAVYLALAELLAAPLVTCDAKLAASPGHDVLVEVY